MRKLTIFVLSVLALLAITLPAAAWWGGFGGWGLGWGGLWGGFGGWPWWGGFGGCGLGCGCGFGGCGLLGW